MISILTALCLALLWGQSINAQSDEPSVARVSSTAGESGYHIRIEESVPRNASMAQSANYVDRKKTRIEIDDDGKHIAFIVEGKPMVVIDGNGLRVLGDTQSNSFLHNADAISQPQPPVAP